MRQERPLCRARSILSSTEVLFAQENNSRTNWCCKPRFGRAIKVQVASDATVYSELQSQAAKLGADAVLVVSAGMKQYASFPGVATYNANGNLYGNGAFLGGHYQATGTAIVPQSYVGLNVQCIPLKRVSASS